MDCEGNDKGALYETHHEGSSRAGGNAVDVDARLRAPRGPHADTRLRGDPRRRDGRARQELAAGNIRWSLLGALRTYAGAGSNRPMTRLTPLCRRPANSAVMHTERFGATRRTSLFTRWSSNKSEQFCRILRFSWLTTPPSLPPTS